MAVVGMKQLLEAGVHFGHQTRRWNPKMKPFIYTERNGIHIIDLQKTVNLLDKAYDFVQDAARQGGRVLFVGTKKQAQEAVAEEASRAGQFYVNQRWLGGLLTNFQTIQERLRRLDQLEQMRDTGVFDRLPKKEQLKLNDEIAKLTRMLGGIRGMRRLPDVLFVIDTKKEHIAIHEANRLDIPIVALLDTNSDPDEVTYPIPANDDAIRAVRLLSAKIADAAAEGARERASTLAKEEAEEGFEPTEYEGYTFEPEGYDSTIDSIVESATQPDEAVEVEALESPDVAVPLELEEAPASEAEPVAVGVATEAPTIAATDSDVDQASDTIGTPTGREEAEGEEPAIESPVIGAQAPVGEETPATDDETNPA